MKQKPFRICEKRVNKGYKLQVNYIISSTGVLLLTSQPCSCQVSQKHGGGTKRSNFNVVLKIQYSTKSKNLNGKLLKKLIRFFQENKKKLGVRGTLKKNLIEYMKGLRNTTIHNRLNNIIVRDLTQRERWRCKITNFAFVLERNYG